MHGASLWIVLAIGLGGLSAFAQQPISTTPSQDPQMTAPGPQRQQPPSSRPQGADKNAPVTNADVLRMVKAGVPESAIVSSIQSSPAKFDLSPDALIGLHKAGVGQKILDAMMAAGNDGKGGSPAGPSQGAAPNAQLKEFSEAEFQKISKEALSKSPGKGGPKIRNPNAGQGRLSTSITAVLESQKKTAGLEHMQALAAGRTQLASGQTGTVAGTPASSAGSSAGTTQTRTQNSGKALASSGALNAKGASSPSLGPSTTSSATGSQSNTALAPAPPAMLQPTNPANPKQLAQPPVTAMMCRGPGVNTVNGKTKGTVFTPEQDYNLYTIKGCYFGNEPGQAYLYGKFKAQKVNLQIDLWTDNEIDARVDPNVSGENDENDVTLAIIPKSGTEMKAVGFGFYAARETVALSFIPSSWVKLAVSTNGFTTAGIDYKSPPDSGSEAAGATAYVHRFMSKKFSFDHDTYDFSQLPPGWATDSMQLFTYDDGLCPGVVTYKQSFGTSTAYWDRFNPNKIYVGWAPIACSGFWPPPPLPPLNIYKDRTSSAYAIKVWVNGPRGTTP